MSAPAMKMERLALLRTSPLILESLVIESISSPSSVNARRSKMFAEDLGRSNVRMQMPSSRTSLRMVRCAAEFGDVLLGGSAATFEASPRFGEVAIIKIPFLISFQPKRRALASSDAERDQRPFRFAPLQFFEA